jgi:uncharacterized protein
MRRQPLNPPSRPARCPRDSLLARRRSRAPSRGRGERRIEVVEWLVRRFSQAARVFPRLPGARWIYGRQLEHQLTVSEAEIFLAGLPPVFDGLTVLLITDLHLGPFIGPDVLERTLGRLATLEPDVILLGGDLTTFSVSDIAPHAGLLGTFTAAAPMGVYAVAGNHEHFSGDPARVGEILEGVGITWLHNRSTWLSRGGSRILLAGIDDLMLGDPDLDVALERTEDETTVSLLLSHNPDIFFDAAVRGVSLVLSGHTHGGQIRIPGRPVLARASRYHLDEGRYAVDDSELVVSRGIGATGLPFRIACSPEVVLVTLRAG